MTKPQDWIHMRSIKSLQKKTKYTEYHFLKERNSAEFKGQCPPIPPLKKFMEILLVHAIKIGS